MKKKTQLWLFSAVPFPRRWKIAIPALFSLLLPMTLVAQSAVIQSGGAETISLAAYTKPLTRKIYMQKWQYPAVAKEQAWTEFQAYLKENKIFLSPPLVDYFNKKYFTGSPGNPGETWILRDGNLFLIRHFDRANPKDLSVEVYEENTCNQGCPADQGFERYLSYNHVNRLYKFDPREKGSYAAFAKELSERKITFRNYLKREIRQNFFDNPANNPKFGQDPLVTWMVITDSRIILRFARENGKDINFEAISLPYRTATSKAWSLAAQAGFSGYSTSNETVESYMETLAGYSLAREFYNGWGALNFSNYGNFRSFLVTNSEIDSPTVYQIYDTTLLEQELGTHFELFSSLDLYHDSIIGIEFGTRALPGIGYNFLGFENRWGIDPKLSVAAGYRYERNLIPVEAENPDTVVFRDAILSYRFQIGNENYGGRAVYWKLQAEYQHALMSSSTLTNETEIFGLTDSYRINYLAQLGIPVLSGNYKLYATYLREEINDQLGEVNNNSWILSFEAKIL